jgi:thiol-disulfide isomerase/thioredoxin
LAEGLGETWLLQFYHDWSEPCKEFAAKWEALARKLPPMVRLARVNIDHNFGLVQRYRAFLRCRQTAFSLGLECSAPTLVLASASQDGSPTGEAYHGALQAEHVYEWLKRSFASRPSAIREVRGRSLQRLARRDGHAIVTPPSPPAAADADARAGCVKNRYGQAPPHTLPRAVNAGAPYAASDPELPHRNPRRTCPPAQRQGAPAASRRDQPQGAAATSPPSNKAAALAACLCPPGRV